MKKIDFKAVKKSAWEWTQAIALTGVAVLVSPVAHAAGALPWEGPLCTVATSLSGPVANSIGVIVVVLTGLMLAVGEVSGVFKSLLAVLFGLSVAFLANNWLGLFNGRSSGCFSTGT
ncbi:TrbC/VirB2 family protein [Crenobacter sp. SG2305]|uniref:TrbC/VirB2 family protein n=1 Tax=Crenobacter oryzisoli TaxID=3056844 RepID=UPI0025AA389A|nr:TrbC/VirB2 family protein [Crenobacter sp. SG2305]MDN0082491.1 TrbC/VirB2 family protein [Crenobacter sp. SG2305]